MTVLNLCLQAATDLAEEEESKTASTSEPADLDTLKSENAELRKQVEKMRQELEQSSAAMGSGRNSWEGASQGRGSWGSDQLTKSREVEEHLKHVRSVMTQFLSKMPVTTRENEDILPVIFSMLNYPKDEIDSISEARSQLENQNQGKKGIFNRNKNNKKKK